MAKMKKGNEEHKENQEGIKSEMMKVNDARNKIARTNKKVEETKTQ